jgi:hypothetical protein
MPEAILFTAAQYAAWFDAQVGKPYILGADGPKAWDCSGLVIGGNNASGAFRMGDDTAAGLYNRSKAVTGSPQVGDLVFLRNNPARSNGIGHVAVLTQKLSNSDWRIIEARGRASGVVRTTLSYWKTRAHYTGVRRLPGFNLAAATIPPPPVAAVTSLRVATLNCLDPSIRQGKPAMLHPLTAGRIEGLQRAVVNAAADFYCLTEAPARIRYELRDAMAGGRARWLVRERGAQAIMFDRNRMAFGSDDDVTRLAWGYHGALAETYTDRHTGQKVTIGTYHLPPNSLVSTGRQRTMLLDFLAKMSHHPGARIVGGDGIDDAAWAKPWKDARTEAATSTTRNAPTYQNSIKDRILSDGPIIWDGYSVKQTTGTDHELVVVKGRISTTSTL